MLRRAILSWSRALRRLDDALDVWDDALFHDPLDSVVDWPATDAGRVTAPPAITA